MNPRLRLTVLAAASVFLILTASGLHAQFESIDNTQVPDGTRKCIKPGSRMPIPPGPFVPLACLAPVVNVSATAGNQQESFVVVNPTNVNNLVAFSNTTSNSIFRAFSMNGGTTWTRGTVATNVACCDAQAAFDTFGNLFVVYINNSVNQINVILSTDGGQTFGAPITVGTGSVDQPSIAVGNGSVWVDWNLSGAMQARGAAVTGLGVLGAFNPVQVIPTGTGSFGGIAVGPGANGGKVMVVYQSPTGGQGPATIFANVDADGLGAGNFGARITVTTTNVGGFDFIPAQNGRSIDAEAGIVWDATGGPFNDRIYLVYTEETVNENNDTDILVRTSTNDGATWSAPVRVNDDPAVPIRSQFLPYITLDRVTGTVAIGFHDCRNDSGVAGIGGTNGIANDDAEYFGTFSTNGGVTWAPNTRLSGGFSNAAAANSGVDFGDYVGQAAHAGKLYTVWADNANCDGTNANGTLSAFDLYSSSLTIGAPTPTPTPCPLCTPTPTPTATPPPTATPTPTATPSVTPTPTPGGSVTPTPTPGCTPFTFPGTGVGSIPDGGSGTLPVYGAPLTISFAVSGRTAPISTVSVDLTLTHSWVGDLDMILTSPGGTASLITVSRIGVTSANSTGDSSNYGGMYNFTDSAAGTNIWTLATAVACDTNCVLPAGDYRTTAGGTTGQTNPPPVTSLNATFAPLTTAQINGTWTLAIRDGAAVDTGSVTAANLKIGQPCATPTPTATPTPPPPTPTPTPPPPTPTPTPIPPTPTPTPIPPTPTPTPIPPTPTPTPPPPTPTPTATPTPTPVAAAQALNLSTRMRVQTGDNVGIGGFIVTGNAPKRVLLRAIGPSITGLPNVLADPVLELHGQGIPTVTNNNWKDDPVQQALIASTGLAPTNDLESAIYATLSPGAYTGVVRGNNNTTGIGLIEVYDLNPAVAAKLGNISTRALVGTGNDIVIAGFILGNNSNPTRLVLRGIGPSLTAFGVPNALADPTLEVRNSSGTLVASNNDWQSDPAQAAELTAAGLAPTNSKESGIALNLGPGAYTGLLSGVGNTTGIGVIEVYDRGAP